MLMWLKENLNFLYNFIFLKFVIFEVLDITFSSGFNNLTHHAISILIDSNHLELICCAGTQVVNLDFSCIWWVNRQLYPVGHSWVFLPVSKNRVSSTICLFGNNYLLPCFYPQCTFLLRENNTFVALFYFQNYTFSNVSLRCFIPSPLTIL